MLTLNMYKTKKTVRADLLADYGVLSIESNRNSLTGTYIQKYLDGCNLKKFNGNIGSFFRQKLENAGANTRDI